MFLDELMKFNLWNVIIISYLFLSSLCGLYILIAPLIPLCFIFKETIRFVMDYLIKSWVKLVTGCFEYLIGTKYFVYGDEFDSRENCMIVMNHRGCLDWLYFSNVAEKFYRLSKLKIVLKHVIKCVPGFGWGIQSSLFVFLKRNWEKDHLYIDKFISFIQKTKFRLQLLIFCEGTYMYEESLEKSKQYSIKNKLPELKYVLQPRALGFTYIFNKLRKTINNNGCFESVHDITIGYKGKDCFYENEVIYGNLPKEAHLLIRRYPANELPTDEIELEKWLRNIWIEKDLLLDYFYKNGHFPFEYKLRQTKKKYKSRFFIGVLYFCVISLFLFLLIKSNAFKYYCFCISVLYIVVTHKFDGFDSLFSKFIFI